MVRYVIRRLLLMIPVVIGVTLLIFLLQAFTPGDPAKLALGSDATEAEIQQWREERDLNDPIIVQYGKYMWGVLHGDFGISYRSPKNITTTIFERWPTTFLVAILSVSISALIGITLGIVAALHRNSWVDSFARFLGMLGVSMPNFWFALLMIILFSLKLKWFPVSGFYGPEYWVLPMATVGILGSAGLMRLTRSAVLDSLSADYIRTARSKGQKESKIVLHHVLRNALIDYWREVHKRYGYVEISTPIILNQELWHRSGHWDHYKDNMYTTVIDGEDYAIKPMNCPGGMLVYASEPHSYRDLPLRVGELGLVHRHELSGALHGLFRVRCFTQDDAHIFMTREQMESEIQNVVRLFDEVYNVFGLKYTVELSTMPEDHIGTVEEWEANQEILKKAITGMGKDFVVNEGDGAFYGPKLDFHIEDCLGRTWQCGTIQLDSQLPERFNLEYTGEDGQKHRPVMIHRVVFGSIERFIGVITEHFAGAFPLWLTPVQVKVLPVTDRAHEYAKGLTQKLVDAGIRAEDDCRSEKLGYKIREAQMQKIPYMLVVGDRDMENGTVSVRTRKGEDLGAMTMDAFLSKCLAEIASKSKDI